MNNYNKDKGLFLQEFYGVKTIPPLKDEEGNPTKFAEAAKYWGEAPPTSNKEVKELVALGSTLLTKQNLSFNTSVNDNSWYGGKQKLSILENNLIKVPFVKKGTWKHDVYGDVTFTDKDVKELITNYKANVTGFTPYLTLGHLDEELNSTDSHRKRGDLKDILEEGDTTYGIFKVSDEIYTRVENGEYEYSSGEFHRNFKDRDSGNPVGTTVLRVALTNSPFLPFGNDKVQALSNEAEIRPENKENYVFLLSLDTSNSDNKLNDEVSEPVETEVEILSIEEEELSNPQDNLHNINSDNNLNIMQTENKVVENQEVVSTEVSTVEEVAAPSKVEVTEAVVKVEEVKTPNQGDQVLANLTSQLQKVQDLYAKQLEAANTTIASLSSKVDALTNKLAGQEELTQAFSSSMSAAQERSLIMNLQNNGVMPSNIQRFISLKNAFAKADNKNIVKFSVGAGEDVKEVEQNVMDAIAELLISASNQSPVIEQQLGVSAGRKSGAFDFSSIITKNQAAAQKLNK